MTRGRWAAAIGIQVTVILFIGVFGTVIPQQNAIARVVSQAFVVPALVATAYFARRRASTPLDLPILVALTLYVIVSALSEDRTTSLQTGAMAAAWTLLFIVMVEVGRRAWYRRAVALAVAGTVTIWLLVLAVTWIGEKLTWVAMGGGMPNLFESTQSMFWLTVNVAPVLVLLAVPFLAYVGADSGGRILRVAFVVGALLTVPLSGGRAGWVGIAAAVVALATMTGGVGPLRGTFRSMPARLAGAGALTAVAGVCVLYGERIFSLSGLSARWPLWSQALSIAAEDPLTGSGPGTYAWVRLSHADDYASRVSAILAHNVPLQTLADGGLLLALGIGLVVGAFFVFAWKVRRARSLPARWALAALLGLAVASLLDDHSSLHAVTAMAVILASWVVADSPDHEALAHRLPGWLLPAGAAIALLVALPFVVRVDQARIEADFGRTAALSGQPSTAAGHFEVAAGLHPENALYRLEAGMTRALAGDTKEAIVHYRRAAELSPGDPRPLGALADLASSSTERVKLLDQAARLTGTDPRYTYRLGLEMLGRGDKDAEAALARAVVIQPTILGSLGGRLEDDMMRALVKQSEETAMELASRLRIRTTDVGDDLALYVGDRPSSAAHRAISALVNGQRDRARAHLAEARRNRPYEARTWEAAAYIARAECDATAYRRAAVLRFWSPGGAGAAPSPDPIRLSFDLPYREVGLGSYQPGDVEREPLALSWPAGLVGEAGHCAGWDLADLEDPFR